MIRLLIATLIAFLATAAYAQNGPQWTLEQMNRTIDEANFVVGKGCSGTLISVTYRLILTAHHCVDRDVKVVEREERQPDGTMRKVRREKRERVTVQQRDYRGHEQVGAISYQTNIVALRKHRDLALLQLVGDNLRSTINAQVLPEAKPIHRGDRVIAVGNPRGLDSTLTSGVVSSTTRAFRVPWAGDDDVPMIQYDAAGAPGSSGGALYDSAGYLIGVTVAGRPGEYVLAIPVSDVRELLRDHCFAEIFDPEANDAACRKEAEAEGETAKDAGDSVDAAPQRHTIESLADCAATLVGGLIDQGEMRRLDGGAASAPGNLFVPTRCGGSDG